jgi:serine phosphatase RsbU (regulator of sigma subunit)
MHWPGVPGDSLLVSGRILWYLLDSMGVRAIFNFGKSRPVPALEAVQAQAPQLREAELAAIYYGQRVGGDFYDFVRVSPDRVLFGLLDVAGRLEENHSIVSAAQDTFRTLGTDLFAKQDINEAEAMIELCLGLNRTILHAAAGVRSCPAFAGCYNETLGTVCYFNAGHTSGLMRNRNGVTELTATGLPLGLFSHSTCDASMVALEPRAALLLVSRGIVEAKHRGKEFGLEQVKDGLQCCQAETAKELCLALLDQVQQFMQTPPTHNDVTTLALSRTAAPSSVAGAS